MTKGQKLYIIHGWTYTTAPWTKTIELLKKSDIEVEMLHVPGLTSPSKKVWAIEDYVKWADQNIPDGAVALGHSNGGRILLNLCAQNPSKLKHLILLDAAGVYEVSSKRDIVRSLSKKFAFLKNIPGVTKIWHKLTGTTDYARAPENMKRTLANMLESDKSLDLAKVTTPTSIIWGEADTVTPPHQAEIMHQQISNSTLEMHPNWTHAPYLSHPEELAKAIKNALKHQPKPHQIKNEVDTNTTARSAALALKRAPEPKLAEKKSSNPVAPDVATKLVLRKDSEITKGMVATDAEGAAVKYTPKTIRRATKTTDSAKDSASLALKRGKKTDGEGILRELDDKSTEKVDFVSLSIDGAPEPVKETTNLPPADEFLAKAITSSTVSSRKTKKSRKSNPKASGAKK